MRSVGNFSILIFRVGRANIFSVLRPTWHLAPPPAHRTEQGSRLIRPRRRHSHRAHRMMSCCVSVVALHTLILGVKGSLKVERGC